MKRKTIRKNVWRGQARSTAWTNAYANLFRTEAWLLGMIEGNIFAFGLFISTYISVYHEISACYLVRLRRWTILDRNDMPYQYVR